MLDYPKRAFYLVSGFHIFPLIAIDFKFRFVIKRDFTKLSRTLYICSDKTFAVSFSESEYILNYKIPKLHHCFHCAVVASGKRELDWHFCSVKKLGNVYRSDDRLLLSVTVIYYVFRSFIRNKTTCIKYCLARWISIHCVRQYMVNFTGLAGIVNTTVYKTEPILTGLGHGKSSRFLTLLPYCMGSARLFVEDLDCDDKQLS